MNDVHFCHGRLFYFTALRPTKEGASVRFSKNETLRDILKLVETSWEIPGKGPEPLRPRENATSGQQG